MPKKKVVAEASTPLEQMIDKLEPKFHDFVYSAGDVTLEFKIKKSLSVDEMITFVNDVVECCYAITGEYIPQVKSFAINRMILTYYTDLKLPEKIDKLYNLCTNTNIIEKLMCSDGFNSYQLYDMFDSIDKLISYRNNSATEAMFGSLKKLIDAASEKLDKVDTSKLDFAKLMSVVGKVVNIKDVDIAGKALKR